MAPNLSGIFQPGLPPRPNPSTVADFDAFASAHAGGIDGLWSSNTLKEVSVVCGPATMALAARTFQSSATSYKGELSSRRLRDGEHGRTLDQYRRMPDASASDIQASDPLPDGPVDDGRRGGHADGRLPPLERDKLSIDDIYSGSRLLRRDDFSRCTCSWSATLMPDATRLHIRRSHIS